MQDFDRVLAEADLGLLAVKLFDFGYPKPKGLLIDCETEGSDGAPEKVPNVAVRVLVESLQAMSVRIPGWATGTPLLCRAYPVELVHVLTNGDINLDVLILWRPIASGTSSGAVLTEAGRGMFIHARGPRDGQVGRRAAIDGVLGTEGTLRDAHQLMGRPRD
jgi:hypothetical protein